ncbi:hypothetical protein FRB98_006665 [Tulasnella sp. 332]|nr:hypothetical protein FRB98_006665 [Tulasnella sp. 332]
MSSLQLPTPQGATSCTWKAPDLSGASTVGEILQHHAVSSPEHTWAVWEDHNASHEHDGDKRAKLSYADWWDSVQNAAKFVLEHGELPKIPIGPKDRRVIAIFATLDPLSYIVLVQAIILLGHTAFPISTRNSVAAVAHLLQEAKAERLIVAGGEPIRKVVHDVTLQISEQAIKPTSLKVINAPTFGSIFPKHGPHQDSEGSRPVKIQTRRPGMSEVALILHSSGSTGFPKAVYFSHLRCVEWMRTPWYGELDVCGTLLGVPSLPPFHAMGMFALFFSAFGSGTVASVFDPTGSPTSPSPEAVLSALKATKVDWTLMVPSFLEAWSDDEEAIAYLSTLDYVMYSGGPLSKKTEEILISHGVKPVVLYAATEFGCPHVYGPHDGPAGWLRFSKQHSHRLVPQAQERTYELALVANEHYNPSVTNVPGVAEYTTSDLIELHPEDNDFFRVIGRVDDQIMLSTGEKTNAGPIEQIIRLSAMVEHAVVFGRAKPHNGILVQPSKGNEIHPNDDAQVTKFRSAVWVQVEEANAFAPQHSHIFKEASSIMFQKRRLMILVTSPNKPIPLTPKQTVMRKKALALYEAEIDACYAAQEHSTGTAEEVPVPTIWNDEDTLTFMRRLVVKVMERSEPPSDEADLFQNGLDSLKATYLRNSIVAVLRSTHSDPRILRLAPDFIYAHPTIRSLALVISSIASASQDTESSMATQDTDDTTRSHVEAMEAAIRKYTTGLPVHTPDEAAHPAPKDEQEVIVLTGSTGGLGSHLLSQLIRMDSVVKVYALNRRSRGTTLAERQTAVLSERLGSSEEASMIMQSPKLCLIEAVLEAEDLSIDNALFEEIRTNTTLIIHNAWRLDFNLVLSSFTPQLDSISTLVRLALRSPHRSPPRILFTSSIATLSNWPASFGPVPEEPLQDLRVAVGNGYGESKAVGEKILEAVGRTTPLRSTNFRIGQLSGSTSSGAWATSDWVPLIARGGLEVGALPDGRGTITWLPVDVAASAILESRHSKFQTLHIVHSHPVTWTSIMKSFSGVIHKPLVPFEQWVDTLEQSARSSPAAIHSNPALALLAFFKTMGASFKEEAVQDHGDDFEAGGFRPLSLAKSTVESHSLKNARSLCEEDVQRWFQYWRNKGFLSA